MNLRNGSFMLGGGKFGLQTVMKKGRNSPAPGQLTDPDQTVYQQSLLPIHCLRKICMNVLSKMSAFKSHLPYKQPSEEDTEHYYREEREREREPPIHQSNPPKTDHTHTKLTS